MRILYRMAWIGILGIALALGASACGESPEAGHTGSGIVKDVDLAARKITLDHEDIPGLMKAMTMTFDVSASVPLEELSRGTEVVFRVKEERGVYTVTEVRRQGS